MSQKIAQRIVYEKVTNGADLYLLETPAKDVVSCRITFGDGLYATYATQVVAALADDLFPSGTKGKKRQVVLEAFELLGVEVSYSVNVGHTSVTIASRKDVFVDAFRLLFDVLLAPTFSTREYDETISRLKNALHHSLDDTRVQARIALRQALFAKGHPHWIPSLEERLRELDTTTPKNVLDFHKKTFSPIGMTVCVVGDIRQEEIAGPLRSILSEVPEKCAEQVASLRVDRASKKVEQDVIVSLKGKMSVDTFAAFPVPITREHTAYHALQMGIQILGASSNARLFSELRTRLNLTYGSYASLEGLSGGYPGYVSAIAIFPNEVFVKGRGAMKEVIRHFAEKGVTPRELKEAKEQIVGSYKVGLSTTTGLCSALSSVLLSGRTVFYLDEYVDIMQKLTIREVNSAIAEYVQLDLLRTAAAGSINNEGLPL